MLGEPQSRIARLLPTILRVLPGRPAGGTRQGFLPGHLDRSNPLPPRSGREKFSKRLAELGDVQHQFRRQRLQTTVLVLERLLPWGAGHFHPVVLRSPIVERRITDAVLAADLGKRITRLTRVQDRNDLFLRETALPLIYPARRSLVQNEGAPRGKVVPGAKSLDQAFSAQILIPGPSFERPKNSMPAASRAERTDCKFSLLLGGTSSTCSNRLIVRTPTPAFLARVSLDHRNAARAARICAPVIT